MEVVGVRGVGDEVGERVYKLGPGAPTGVTGVLLGASVGDVAGVVAGEGREEAVFWKGRRSPLFKQ